MTLLEGVRVLDLSRILAGPWCTQVLADFGADVIKVERPGVGDDTRGWGPPYLKDGDGNDTAESAYYLCANRGKRSLAIDFTTTEGQALVHALVGRCDVLVENYKVGGLAKYGLDAASLLAINPKLVYCSITGYGQDGPYAQRAGYDAAIQAIGGLMSVTGEPDGAPGAGPQKVGVAATDLMTGMYAATAILAALRHAERTGRGQQIDLALLDTQVAWLANQASNYLVGGLVPDRQGTAHPNIVPYQVMPAADGYFMLAVGNDAQFARLCEVIGEAQLAVDPRYATNRARVAHRAELVPHLQQRLRMRPAAEWLAALEAAVVPANPVNRIDQVFDDPQVQARGLRIDVPHAAGGSVAMVRNPLKFSGTPLQYTQAAPLLGQHTTQVLGEVLAMGEAQLQRLRGQGVIGG
ncbi:CaiB/BaiF CoA-transferase family protein [Stenotrophomonas sp. MH1]|uniref:CaiB/BaiF CoA-transferase family protein n=1 Tax=Stenotrophomonas capsici TaxID=3110230 RepID=A0ABU5V3U1_9GAMM|nr:CaiB/BaiF CoA-transferase family protein [Stenotrophomonas sp. MH1]MEA5668043.1 CaiB/BaiF CoA-transferase family protein [Stenotrophomonas sp. MH1]